MKLGAEKVQSVTNLACLGIAVLVALAPKVWAQHDAGTKGFASCTYRMKSIARHPDGTSNPWTDSLTPALPVLFSNDEYSLKIDHVGLVKANVVFRGSADSAEMDLDVSYLGRSANPIRKQSVSLAQGVSVFVPLQQPAGTLWNDYQGHKSSVTGFEVTCK